MNADDRIMAITIKDIAKKLNISYATVSKALSDSREISEATKEKVRNTAREMNYKPNAIARGLVMKKTKTIGLIIPDITNPFYPEIARAVEETVNKEGYSVIFCNSDWKCDKETEYVDLLISKKVDGIILAPTGEQMLELGNIDIPIVIVGKRNGYNNSDYVVIDDKKGGFLATEHLIKCGCRKIMFVGGKQNVESNRDRLDGYKQALNLYNIAIDELMIRNGNFKRESGYVLMREVLEKHYVPDGVFAGNDMLALGVIQAINEFGYKIPEDISVIGFDDIPFAELPEISLTTIAQPKYKMGILAAEEILAKIKNESVEDGKIVMTPELVIRKTTHYRV